MKLLDYLEPMKMLPNRFSNLAFWRVLRVFKDKVVEAFTYVNSWGNGIEGDISGIHDNITNLENADITLDGRVTKLEEGGGGTGGTDYKTSLVSNVITVRSTAVLSYDANTKSMSVTFPDSSVNPFFNTIKIGTDIITLHSVDIPIKFASGTRLINFPIAKVGSQTSTSTQYKINGATTGIAIDSEVADGISIDTTQTGSLYTWISTKA